MRFFYLLILLIAASGCKRSSSSSHSNRPVPGEMVASANDVIAADFYSSCDDKNKDKMLFVAQYFDTNSTRYETLSNAIRAEKKDGYSLGQVFLTLPEDYTPQDKWQTFEYSWDKIYSRITAESVLSDRSFMKLASITARLLMHDLRRRKYGSNYSINYFSKPYYEKALKIVDDCVARPDCKKVSFPEDVLEQIKSYWWVREELNYMSTVEGVLNFRTELDRLKQSLTASYNRFQFRQERTIKRISTAEIELPLDIGDLKGQEDRVKKMVEAVWTSRSLRLKIRWTNQVAEPNVFRFVINAKSKEPPHVSYDKQEIFLPNTFAEITFSHEIGHVLGFKDYYFEYYNYSRCGFEYWYRDDDIMSTANKALIPESRWQTLNREYPVN